MLFGLPQGPYRGGIDRGQLGKALLALFRLELEPLELLLMLYKLLSLPLEVG